MKKLISMLLVLVLALTVSSFAFAEDYVPGVTVTANPESKTGYTVTIVFEAPAPKRLIWPAPSPSTMTIPKSAARRRTPITPRLNTRKACSPSARNPTGSP